MLIDEASSTLERDNEKLLFALLTSIGTTFITAGNGTTLAKFHTHVVEIAADGTWKHVPASEYDRKSWRALSFLIPDFLKGDKDNEK